MLTPKIINVATLENYKLLLTFDTNEEKIFDVTPYISGDWFGLLKNKNYFNTAHISGYTVEWEGGQDIAPHELYEQSTKL